MAGLGVNTDFGLSSINGLLANVNSAASSSIPVPWNQYSTSTFFPSIDIDPTRWDELFPYRLMVVDSKTNLIINAPSVNGSLIVPKITVIKGTGSTTVDFEPSLTSWIFTLPISPQQLNITDVYSINTTATLRGVLEEHNGIKFKMITASGTFGVWPYRDPVVAQSNYSGGLVQSLFGSTLNAASAVATQFTKTINAFTGNSPIKSIRPENSTNGYGSTGYYFALSLQQFLEQYAEAKKDPANAYWRLVLDIPKQKQSFVVTPMSFQWQQSANKPMEILFNLQLKAWRRIALDESTKSTNPNNQPISPDYLQVALNGIYQARNLLSKVTGLVGAVTSDFNRPFNILKQVALFYKQLLGTVNTVADLPNQLYLDYKSSISFILGTIDPNTIPAPTNSDPQVQSYLNKFKAAFQKGEGAGSGQSAAQSAASSAQAAAKSNGSSSYSAGQAAQRASSSAGSAAISAANADPSNNIFTEPNVYPSPLIFDQVPVNELSLTNAQLIQYNAYTATIQAITISDLKQLRQQLLTFTVALSNYLGTGSSYYSQVFNIPPPLVRIQPITIDQYEILSSLYNVIQNLDVLTASTQIDDNNIQTNMDYVAGLASQAGITFNTSTSKILAPVPFGLTIEGIAARYLGDPQRWLEIVTLNNLIDPYIDENGFQYSLLSNGTGREIIVGNNTNLYIGQIVTIYGMGQLPSARTILSIKTLSETSFLITLDGLPNLNIFTLANNAYLQGYLPGTVNSQQKIFIPSNLPVPDVANIIPPASTTSDPYTALSKVDWLLTDSGDIAINSFGDFRLSSGMTNLIQSLKIKFSTSLGTVLLHPNFGLAVKPGTINSEIQIQDLYNSINQMISQDPRFSSVANLQITLNGPTLNIYLQVTLAGIQGVFPIQFNLSTTGTALAA